MGKRRAETSVEVVSVQPPTVMWWVSTASMLDATADPKLASSSEPNSEHEKPDMLLVPMMLTWTFVGEGVVGRGDGAGVGADVGRA